MGGMENGLVDLQMATEAFRDAFSATAPPLEGPADTAQDYLLAEAYKSPANPVTGVAHSTRLGMLALSWHGIAPVWIALGVQPARPLCTHAQTLPLLGRLHLVQFATLQAWCALCQYAAWHPLLVCIIMYLQLLWLTGYVSVTDPYVL